MNSQTYTVHERGQQQVPKQNTCTRRQRGHTEQADADWDPHHCGRPRKARRLPDPQQGEERRRQSELPNYRNRGHGVDATAIHKAVFECNRQRFRFSGVQPRPKGCAPDTSECHQRLPCPCRRGAGSRNQSEFRPWEATPSDDLDARAAALSPVGAGSSSGAAGSTSTKCTDQYNRPSQLRVVASHNAASSLFTEELGVVQQRADRS
jgi:hypothetical protein